MPNSHMPGRWRLSRGNSVFKTGVPRRRGCPPAEMSAFRSRCCAASTRRGRASSTSTICISASNGSTASTMPTRSVHAVAPRSVRPGLSEHHGDGTPGSTVWVPVGDVRALHAELHATRYGLLNPGVEDYSPGGRPSKSSIRSPTRSGSGRPRPEALRATSSKLSPDPISSTDWPPHLSRRQAGWQHRTYVRNP